VETYIAGALTEDPGAGGLVTSPIILPALEISLADSGWTDLLDVIAAADRFVELDLSACDITGMTEIEGEFDPDFNTVTGKGKIVSLVLPDTAASIEDSVGSPIFAYFDNLNHIEGAAVTAINGWAFFILSLNSVSFPTAQSVGNDAFRDCYRLSEVSLPAAQSVGTDAFTGCTGLRKVSLPAAQSVDHGAFQNCTGLTEVSLPAAQSIGNYAFAGCTSLSKVSLPAAQSIGESAFSNCHGLSEVSLPVAKSFGYRAFWGTGRGPLTVTLGGTVPTLGTRLFYDSKTVIVRVPGNEAWSAIISDSPYNETGASYTDNWGNGFRGGGWEDDAMIDSNDVQSNINLTVAAQ
jgi:hypothetical protein